MLWVAWRYKLLIGLEFRFLASNYRSEVFTRRYFLVNNLGFDQGKVSSFDSRIVSFPLIILYNGVNVKLKSASVTFLSQQVVNLLGCE